MKSKETQLAQNVYPEKDYTENQKNQNPVKRDNWQSGQGKYQDED